MQASYQSSSDRRRGTSFALAVVAHLLLLLVLVRLAPKPPPPPEAEVRPATFSMLPAPDAKPAAAPRAKPAQTRKAAAAAAPKAAERPVTPATKAPVPQPPMPELIGGKEMFEAADISKLGAKSASGDDGADKSGGAAYGPGEGPGGERLYNAEWYREPTRAEMAFYLPPGGAQPGWALIACKTIEDYHVDNCRALGESPVGSGLARALRQAAWQFRVRPPRIGGRAVLGAWVRIRFDFTTGTVN